MGRWQPEATAQTATYRLWAVLGGLELLVGYRLTVLGFATRFSVRRFDRTTTRIGLAVPVGWTLGILVTLSNLVRPRDDEDDEE